VGIVGVDVHVAHLGLPREVRFIEPLLRIRVGMCPVSHAKASPFSLARRCLRSLWAEVYYYRRSVLPSGKGVAAVRP
jgi:hypothetical protein